MSTETTAEMCGCHLPPRPMNAHALPAPGASEIRVPDWPSTVLYPELPEGPEDECAAGDRPFRFAQGRIGVPDDTGSPGPCNACGCDWSDIRTLGSHGGGACINPNCQCSDPDPEEGKR